MHLNIALLGLTEIKNLTWIHVTTTGLGEFIFKEMGLDIAAFKCQISACQSTGEYQKINKNM